MVLRQRDVLMRLSPLGWLRPRARVRVVDEKGDICRADAEACKLGPADRTRLSDGPVGAGVRRGIWKAAAKDWSTGLSFILRFGLVCDCSIRG